MGFHDFYKAQGEKKQMMMTPMVDDVICLK